MVLRRGPREVEWQRELATGGYGGTQALTAEASKSEVSRWRRLQPSLWRTVRTLTAFVGFAAAVIGKHHVVGIVILGVWVSLWPLDTLARRRLRRQSEYEAEPTIEGRVRTRLYVASQDLRWFLRNPPERRTYAKWLKTTSKGLEWVSPDVARRWGRPDRGSGGADGVVSEAELASRRELLLALYAEVATPEQLTTLTRGLPQVPSARAITSS